MDDRHGVGCRFQSAGSQGQEILGLVRLLPDEGLPEFPLNRRNEALEVALHHVVPGTGAHGLDGNILAHAARNKNERHGAAAVPDHSEGLSSAEAGDAVVAENDIPRLLIQSRKKRL